MGKRVTFYGLHGSSCCSAQKAQTLQMDSGTLRLLAAFVGLCNPENFRKESNSFHQLHG